MVENVFVGKYSWITEYTDEVEYQNDSDETYEILAYDAVEGSDALINSPIVLNEGKLLIDLDYVYSLESFKQRRSSMKSLQDNFPNNRSSSYGSVGGTATNSNSTSARTNGDNALKFVSEDDNDNIKCWPEWIEEFRINERVDALDHKGAWYSGTIVDYYVATEKDIVVHDKVATLKPNREIHLRPSGSSKKARAEANEKVRISIGCHIRVHFDNFSSVWDEWYDQTDLDQGKQS